MLIYALPYIGDSMKRFVWVVLFFTIVIYLLFISQKEKNHTPSPKSIFVRSESICHLR